MKNPRTSVDARRLAILNKIRQQDEVKVEELAEELNLSLMTIRRDLQFLEERQLITRFYGGATARLTTRPLSEEDEYRTYRQRIAEYASRFINSGDTVFINGSCTALAALEFVRASNVRVYTNNGKAVSREFAKGVSVILTGGELRDYIMVGDHVMRNLLNVTADKTFIGCAAISAKGELYYNIPTEIGINEAMISRTSKELFILADHTKLCHNIPLDSHYGGCIYEHPWSLITDEKADPSIVESLRAIGKQVYVVGIDDILV